MQDPDSHTPSLAKIQELRAEIRKELRSGRLDSDVERALRAQLARLDEQIASHYSSGT